MTQPKTAASQIWPHLAQGTPSEVQQRRVGNSVADAFYPGLTKEQRAWDAWRKRDRDSLLRNLRELNARWRSK